MTLRDLFGFLIGRREAILAIARCRGALAIGALLVLSGGLARNYDGAYLPAEWHVLLHGIVVSSLNALLLFSIVYAAAWLKGMSRPPLVAGFLSFLALFWTTAPMAWLYAIPYERFLSPEDAVKANAWTLAFVSLWRVLLITRVLSVLWGATTTSLFFLVMLFADVVLVAAVALAPGPVVDFMGGLQHTPEDTALASINFLVGLFGILTSPVWIIGALAAVANFRGCWTLGPHAAIRVSKPVRVFAAFALLAWIPMLAVTQPEQRLRRETEQMLRAGDVQGAFMLMSSHRRNEFPPVWSPPPRLGYNDSLPTIEAVRIALAADDNFAPWVRDIFLSKSWRVLTRGLAYGSADSPALVTHWAESVTPAQANAIRFHFDHDERPTDADRAMLRLLLAKAGREEDEPKPPP